MSGAGAPSQFILVPHLSRGRCDRVVTSGLDPCDQAHGVDRTPAQV